MCCEILWKRIIPFISTVIIGLLTVNFTTYRSSESNRNLDPVKARFFLGKREGTGTASCTGNTDFSGIPYNESPKISKFKILSKPHAEYTDLARQNQVTGTVRIRAAFSASGEVINIHPITSLPDGLTEQAMIAATKIRFHPELRNGKPVSITKVIEYSFTIY